ncbi:hypothetical protein C1H46_012127 [Malus baccata]|uniref:ABC1 atypical kinase-like domain-containing protein n=1 Tax=Malus baccata TaxID=106549 RepID=A0A540MTX8_MALBA|nr:hypothetical protein C1H46_012127 [Malus baccata]
MAARSLPLPELTFLSPQTTPKRRLSISGVSLSKFSRNGYPRSGVRSRIRAVKEEGVVVEERIKKVNGVELGGNGAAAASTSGSGYGSNGSVNSYSNGSAGVIRSKNGAVNGSLVKFVSGNGVAAEVVQGVQVLETKEEGRRKNIEEIGKEDAWFKQSGLPKVEVSVAPGGRWSRFKTYSTIQRTLEIWGFVLKFIIKAWLGNKKFTYRGGMTEEKKTLRRKALAKWLKENILRLGPTFIKIGQQFSTRVDILAQEYVDQLSELQVGNSLIQCQQDCTFLLVAVVSEHAEYVNSDERFAFSFNHVIAEYLQKIDPKSDGAKRDWVAIYDECANVLYEVLTMEYVPGIKINKIQAIDQLGLDRQRLGRYAVESYLEQILSHGFFHADPHPGNIAVDDVNGGRLIFYDFGMMGSISPNIREGLLETFYGVYEKDPDKVLQAMVQMGVLVPTGDMTAVRRTALFFLNSFEERLAAQRKEKELATAELGFKKPLSKEEKIMKRKERLAAIGEDLLAIAADQPFRFPATFTFVVRAFSGWYALPCGYALELLKFREAGVEDLRNRWDRQSRAFYNLFRQADRVEKLAEIIQRLEQGDLKLRVRTLESERAFQRVATVQKTVGNAVAAGSLINLATILYINSIRVPAIAAYVFCAFFSLQVLIGLIKVKKFDERERLITGTA